MKTLKNHVLIYDDECPMCDLYTRGFVNSKMLDAQGRVSFNHIDDEIASRIDRQRACDEIALVNTQDGTVYYGINSLFTVIGNSFPIFKPLFRSDIFLFLMKKLYAFISYNRKVIAPSKYFEDKNRCNPSFHLPYRLSYIFFLWVITSIILNAYAQLMVPVVPVSSLFREFIICGGQIVFQAGIVLMLNKDRLVHYLGNMMTISLAGAVALLPPTLFESITGMVSSSVALAWFGLVVCGMFLEHIRRVKLLSLHWSVSVSWVLYRLIALFVIYSFQP